VVLLKAVNTFPITFLADPDPEITEDHGIVEHMTALDVETIFPLGGKRRALTVQFKLKATQATEMQALRRYVGGRAESFLIWPFATDDEPWIVRHEEREGTRVYHRVRNTFPFRVKELSRGLPWP
jgi:hypothetical protein